MRLVPRIMSLGVVLPLAGLLCSLAIASSLFRRSLVQDVDRRLLAQAAVESVSLFDGTDGRPHVHMPRSALAAEVAAFAPRTAIDGSPAPGYCDAPAEFVLVPRRITVPPAQRRPSPKTAPAPPLCCDVPWKYSTELSGIPEPASTNVSAVMLAAPLAASTPPCPSELAQPAPAAPLLPHGHAVPVPSPEQNANVVTPAEGTSAVAANELGEPAFHSPTVTVPLCGATSASKRKL